MSATSSSVLLKWIGITVTIVLLALGAAGTNYSMHSADRQVTAELKETTNRTLDDHERRLVSIEQDRAEIKANQRVQLELLHAIRRSQGD